MSQLADGLVHTTMQPLPGVPDALLRMRREGAMGNRLREAIAAREDHCTLLQIKSFLTQMGFCGHGASALPQIAGAQQLLLSISDPMGKGAPEP